MHVYDALLYGGNKDYIYSNYKMNHVYCFLSNNAGPGEMPPYVLVQSAVFLSDHDSFKND